VCHAEENENINQVTEAVFERKSCNPNFTFSLSPIRQVSFKVYDDIKYSLSGTIESPEFATLVKTYFMRVFALKLRHLAEQNTVPKIMKGSFNIDYKAAAEEFDDREWLRYLKVDELANKAILVQES